MRPLTVRQRQIFDFIVDAIKTNGYAPSLAEIGQQFHLSSLATCHKHVKNLQDKGYIRRWSYHSRAIEIVVRADGYCPTCGRALHAEAAI